MLDIHFILTPLFNLGKNAMDMPTGLILTPEKPPNGSTQYSNRPVLDKSSTVVTLMVPSDLLDQDNGSRSSTIQSEESGNHGSQPLTSTQKFQDSSSHMRVSISLPFTVSDTWHHNGLERQYRACCSTGLKTKTGPDYLDSELQSNKI